MSFDRTRGPGAWVGNTNVTSSELEDIDDKTSKAIDGDGGGAYAPTEAITVGGGGLEDANILAHTITNGLGESIDMGDYHKIIVYNGGLLTNGSLTNIDLNFAADGVSRWITIDELNKGAKVNLRNESNNTFYSYTAIANQKLVNFRVVREGSFGWHAAEVTQNDNSPDDVPATIILNQPSGVTVAKRFTRVTYNVQAADIFHIGDSFPGDFRQILFDSISGTTFIKSAVTGSDLLWIPVSSALGEVKKGLLVTLWRGASDWIVAGVTSPKVYANSITVSQFSTDSTPRVIDANPSVQIPDGGNPNLVATRIASVNVTVASPTESHSFRMVNPTEDGLDVSFFFPQHIFAGSYFRWTREDGSVILTLGGTIQNLDQHNRYVTLVSSGFRWQLKSLTEIPV